jgi:hypothetical protein
MIFLNRPISTALLFLTAILPTLMILSSIRQ